ncbi:cytokine receptor-like factor 2 isoform X2 [Sceloporus undulatus]|uniref:cytokine receptor-like factor 2 isoform X2 n=1 Tax=Sceloporus undulatus TaxID=8520 RepID=UPI001C4C299B|nr:cytokine receptor-like factor 2 isoform X2 [Sceloporus undulatus]
MGCSIHSSVVVHLWVNLLASQTWAQFLCSPLQSNEYPAYPEEIDFENDTHDSCFNYTLVHFPNELTEVRWDSRKYFPDMNMTMFYKLNDLKWKQCPQYILDQGYNTGCVFQAEKDAHLHISIRDTNGTKDLYFDEQHIFKFLKPDPPENVTIQWMDGEVIAQCMPSQPPQNFELEFQYKSRFDKDWQSRKNDCCKIKDQGFDLEKCYTFRFRLKNIYGDYSSEWTAETLWTNGSSVDSCATEISEPEFSTIILLTSVMAGVLIIFVLLLCLCRLDRIRKTLMPVIPDPKNIYSELFTGLNGDFQDWVSKTENLLAETKLECIEEECVTEEKGEGFQENKAEA